MSFSCNHTSAEDGISCQKILDEGWITACSHLFCLEHARAWFGNRDDCPICRGGPVKVVRMDLSRTSVRRRGRTALIGMAPPDILRATEIALNFWTDQKVFDFQREGRRQVDETQQLQSSEARARASLAEAEAACDGLAAESARLRRQIGDAGNEIQELGDQCERLRHAYAQVEAETSRTISQKHNLQSQASKSQWNPVPWQPPPQSQRFQDSAQPVRMQLPQGRGVQASARPATDTSASRSLQIASPLSGAWFGRPQATNNRIVGCGKRARLGR